MLLPLCWLWLLKLEPLWFQWFCIFQFWHLGVYLLVVIAGLGGSCAGEALSSLSLSPLVPGGLSESSFLTFDSFWPPSYSLPVTDVKNFFHSTAKRSAISVCDAGQWGVPSHIRSDRGHNFVSSEFGTFCKDLGISLNFSSGYHHSANQAELAVCTVKDLKDTFFF